MFTAFKGLKPFQLSEYIFLALFAFCVPFSWRIATYVMIGLALSCVLKGVFEEGFKINQLQYKNKLVYIVSIAFWALYAVSFFYSENTAEARFQIGKKLPFFLFPLFFMTSNLSYLTKDRIRTIMYCFVCGILLLSIVNIMWAGYDVLIGNESVNRFYEPRLLGDGTGYIHHSYTSIYACLGIVFCFYDYFVRTIVRIKLFDFFSILLLILFTVLSGSRAGVLCIVAIFLMMWFWLTFIKKEKKIGFVVGIVILCLIIVSGLVFRKSIDRITDTISNLNNIEKQDRRIGITIGYKNLLIDNFLFGVGAGDRSDETLNSYLEKKEELIQNIKPVDGIYSSTFEENRRMCLESVRGKYKGTLSDSTFEYAEEMAKKYGCDYNSVRENLATFINVYVAIDSGCNAHNQYSDTIIAVGIIGLILLFGLFFMPIYLWIKDKNFDIIFFSLLFIIAFNCLFESVFERQMGIMFFTFFYFLLFHANFCQQSTDNGQQSSSI